MRFLTDKAAAALGLDVLAIARANNEENVRSSEPGGMLLFWDFSRLILECLVSDDLTEYRRELSEEFAIRNYNLIRHENPEPLRIDNAHGHLVTVIIVYPQCNKEGLFNSLLVTQIRLPKEQHGQLPGFVHAGKDKL